MVVEAKILTKHPLGRSGKSISKQKYETMKQAILAALRDKELTYTDFCKDADTQCLLEETFVSGNLSLLVIRFTGTFIGQYSADQIDAAVWGRLKQTHGATLNSLEYLALDGRLAVERIFTVPSAQAAWQGPATGLCQGRQRLYPSS